MEIAFTCGGIITLSASSEVERSGWMEALENASFTAIRARVERIKAEIQAKTVSNYQVSSSRRASSSSSSSSSPIKSCGYVTGTYIVVWMHKGITRC
jgi:hypothetical protein